MQKANLKMKIGFLILLFFLILGGLYYFQQKDFQRQAKPPQVPLSQMLAQDRKKVVSSPWAQAYKNGDLQVLLEPLSDTTGKKAEDFFQFSIHYLDMKEIINLSESDFKKWVEAIFLFLERNEKERMGNRTRTLLFTFLKKLRGRGQDDLLKSKLLPWTHKWNPKNNNYLDSLDVLVGISPFDKELLKSCLQGIKTKPDHETFSIIQVLNDLKDSSAMKSFLETLEKNFSKASPEQQPFYFKILMEKSKEFSMNMSDKIPYAMKQNSDLWIDALLTSVHFSNDPQQFRPFLNKVIQDGSRPHFQNRAATVLKSLEK